MSRIYLKIKLKSLAAEARIIRHEETKWKLRSRPYRRARDAAYAAYLASTANQMPELPEEAQKLSRHDTIFWKLREHRTFEVRSEARNTVIAYGYLRGLPYAAIEQKSETSPDWNRIAKMIEKYGTKDVLEKRMPLKDWAAVE